MKNRNVIYTAISGNYDKLIEPLVVMPGFDYICFTDKIFKSKVWKIRGFDQEFNDPTLTAKKLKILPHRYLGKYESSIWIDGNILLKNDITHLFKYSLSKNDLAFFRHPENRKTLKEELNKCITLKKDNENLMKKQVSYYYKLGYSDQSIIFPTCYIIFRKHNIKKIKMSMEEWWTQILSYSKRDQLSFPYIAWKHNLTYTLINHDDSFSNFFERKQHNSSLTKTMIKKIQKILK